METLTQGVSSTRADRRRHRSGCFRWYGDGRCVDCGAYTGTAKDVVEVVTDVGMVYSRPRAEPKHRLARLIARPIDANEPRTVAPATSSRHEQVEESLTADQLAVRRAWRQWRAEQGDAEPDIPRRQRRRPQRS
jgi:hypothetical protein